MLRENCKIAITGHIDHGKSTLIGRLLLETNSLPQDKLKELKKISKDYGKDTELAYLADQLKEERERNITIDTTEVFLKTAKRDYTFIDTPGHLEFIKNMLTGASHAESAMILVDAHEGVMDQTRRHAYLIRLLSLENVLVMVNKMDLIGYDHGRYQALEGEITSLMDELGIDLKYIIPVSAKEGVNISKLSSRMPWYKGPHLLKAMDTIRTRTASLNGNLRFPVQDVYSIDNQDVFVGRIASGTVRQGQDITILPAGTNARIREIKVFEQKRKKAVCQECVGLILENGSAARRGDVFCESRSPAAVTSSFTGNLFWLSSVPLKKGGEVRVRCSTQTVDAEVETIIQRIDPSTFGTLEKDAAQINPNEAGLVRFKLAQRAVMEHFQELPELGRYTLERNNALEGAGTVLANR